VLKDFILFYFWNVDVCVCVCVGVCVCDRGRFLDFELRRYCSVERLTVDYRLQVTKTVRTTVGLCGWSESVCLGTTKEKRNAGEYIAVAR
jgi:hypothetical protein